MKLATADSCSLKFLEKCLLRSSPFGKAPIKIPLELLRDIGEASAKLSVRRRIDEGPLARPR